MTELIHGAGGGKGGGSARTPKETKDNLHSTAYARIIDLISEGEIEGLVNGTDSIFLDGTPLTRGGVQNFEALDVEERVGTQNQTPIPGFPAVENGVEVGVEVVDHTPWLQDFTNPEINAIRVQVSVPALSRIDTSNGDTKGHTIGYAIDLAVDGGPFREVLSTSFSGKTTTKYERSHDVALTEKAQTAWTVRVRRTTENANSSTVNDRMFVDMVTEVIDGNFSYPNSALVGLQVSSEHFQSIPKRAYHVKGLKVRVPDNYDPESRVYYGVWQGGWKVAWTNNPAWIFMDLATHPRYGLGDRIPVGLMDKWALYDIARYCDEMVSDGMGGTEPRFVCNTYIQSRENAYELLQKLASVFRGMAYYSSGIVTAVADQPKSKQYVYTNSKVVDGRFSYSGSPKSTRYTVALVSYNDPNDFFNTRVEYVEDRSGYAKYGHQETQLTAFGCSSRAQAHRLGKWALLTSQIETQTCNFTVGLEGLYSRPGDVIQVMDQDLIGEHKGGLVVSADSDSITADVDFQAEPGDTLTVMLPSGVAQSRTVSYVSGRTLTVSQDFTEIPQTHGSWVVEGEIKPQSYRVLSIVEKEEGTQYELTCIEYREDKFDFVDHGTKLDPRPVTAIPPSIQPPPENVTISQRVVTDQGIANTIATISWEAPEHAIAYEGYWRKDEGEWVPFFRTGSTSVEIPGIYAGRYVARVYAINALDIRSVAATSAETHLEGKTTPPPVVTHLTTHSRLYGIDLAWGFSAQGSEDVLRTEVWVSLTSDFNDATKLTDLAYPQNTFSHVGLGPTAELYYWVRLVDKSGNHGDFYPDGPGVYGEPSQEANDYLDAFRDEVLTAEAGKQLVAEEVDDILQDIDLDIDLGGIEDESQELIRLMTEAERHIREDEDSNVTYQVDVLEQNVDEDLSAKVQQLQEAITNSEMALASDVTSLEARVDNNLATIHDELTTLATQDSAMSQAITNLESQVGNDITSAISNLQQTMTSEDQALAQSITNLQSQIDDDITSAISNLQQTVASEDQALSQSITNLQSQIDDDITSAISNLQQTVASEDQALAQSITNLQSQIDDDITSAISNLQQTMASEDQALAQSITNLTTTVNNNQATADSRYTTLVNKDSALTQSINNLGSTVGGLSSSVTTHANTIANLSGQLSAQYNIKTSVTSNGIRYWAGLGLGVENNPNGPGFISQIMLQADRVALLNVNNNSTTVPFAVQGGSTFIANAMIQNGSITSAKIANASISTAKIVDGAITNAKLANASITNAKIANAAITSAKIGTAQIDTLRIAGGAVSATVTSTARNFSLNIPVNSQVVFIFQATNVIDVGYGTGEAYQLVTLNVSGVGTLPAGSVHRFSSGPPLNDAGDMNWVTSITTGIVSVSVPAGVRSVSSSHPGTSVCLILKR